MILAFKISNPKLYLKKQKQQKTQKFSRPLVPELVKDWGQIGKNRKGFAKPPLRLLFVTFSVYFQFNSLTSCILLNTDCLEATNDRRTDKMFLLFAHFYIPCLTSGRNICKLGAHTWQSRSDQNSLVFADFPWIYIKLTSARELFHSPG